MTLTTTELIRRERGCLIPVYLHNGSELVRIK